MDISKSVETFHVSRTKGPKRPILVTKMHSAHADDLLLGLFHLLLDTLLEVFDLLQVVVALLFLDSKPGSSGLAILHLALLELEVIFHILYLLRSR